MGDLCENEGFKAGRSQDPFTDDLKSFIDHVMRHYHIPSLAIGIIDGEQTFTNTFGDAKVGDTKATEDTLYFIASCTKSMTATTLLSVLEELGDGPDAITLKTKIASIVPDFVLQDDYATTHATLEDALSHLLGVGNHNLSYGGEGYTVLDSVRSLRHLSMTAELREKYQYLNLGYEVILHVVETLTGKPIEDAHHKHIWGPLGMNSTYIDLKDAQNTDKVLAKGYTWDPLSKKQLDAPYARDFPLVGGGGVITSIKDFTAYLRGVIHKSLPLSDARHDELFKPRCIASPPSYEHMSTNLYALGWGVSSYRGRRLISHSGGIAGFASKLLFLPEQKWGIAILANSDLDGAFANEAVIMRMMNDFLQIPSNERQDIMPLLDKKMDGMVQEYLNVRKTLYPNVVKPREGVPVADGTNEVLHSDIRRLLDITIDLEHVSGEYFIAWVDTETSNVLVKSGLRAQFVIGPDGKVAKCGIQLDPISRSDDDRMMVWFTKVMVAVIIMFMFITITDVTNITDVTTITDVTLVNVVTAVTAVTAITNVVNGLWEADIKRKRAYGPVVRIGPNHLGLDGSIGWPEVYSHRKGDREEYSKLPGLFPGDEKSIIIAPRDVHRRERRQLGHAFSDSALMQQESTIGKYVDLLIERLTDRAKQNQLINMVEWFNFTTFDIIGDLAFSDSFHSLANNGYHPWVKSIFEAIRGASLRRVYQIYPIVGNIADFFNLVPASKTSLRIRGHAKEKTLARMKLGEQPVADFVAYMMRKTRDGSEGMSDAEILATAPVLVFAGSETTATALSGFCFYISKNPRVYDILADEIRGAFKTEADISFRSTAAIEYLQATIDEILRVYPPAAETPARVSPGDMIDGKYVPAGTRVSVYQWATFRNPNNFAEPNAFLPERWLTKSHPRYDERFDGDNRAVFKPFSHGSRDCIGKNLAQAEMRYIIARLLYRFDIELESGQDDWHEKQRTFVVWEKGPLNVRLRPRTV
ncbi:penicillin-binding protein [Purpureocillium lavendulum]|uniref:Penicillin-binding protein n=1 Tax=Purpureocillium lavendulum TaxID=1247861 RepID=A0AB34FQF8_9HYPO|nr:penicillin-binding protein [Purpureocillium lavendulum]